MNQTTTDARALSSGTIGGLIRETKYDIIDLVQAQFVQFCAEHEGQYDTWVKAWYAFEDSGRMSKEFPTVAGEGAPQYAFLVEPETQLSLKI